MLAALLTGLAADRVVRLLFGLEYAGAVPSAVILMPAVVLLGVNTVYMNYFSSLEMPMFVVYSLAAAAILNITLNWQLIPRLGIEGAALASVICYGLMLAASVVYSRSVPMRKIA